MSEKDKAKTDLALDLNFAPSWARTDPDENIQRYRDTDFEQDAPDSRRGGDGFRDRRPRRDFDRDERGGDRRRGRDRPPRQRRDDRFERRDHSDMPRPESRGAVADLRGPSAPRQERPPRGGDRGNHRQFDRGGERRQFRHDIAPLPLDIRVLPEQHALGAVIRRIQTSHRAFPLRDIAWLFLDNPASCLLRVEPQKDQQIPLFQCKVCGMPGLTEEEIRNHLLAKHFSDFFEAEEITCDPPSGTFVCVCRCGLSGELLGPPNHHSYKTKVHEMLRRYPNMTEDAYRSRIETVRDPEAIEQWRQQCTKKKVYRLKTAEPAPKTESGENAEENAAPQPAPQLDHDTAEMKFISEIMPGQIISAKHLVCTAAVAMQCANQQLVYALRGAILRERRFPVSLFFALRGAFRHRKLHLFRVNDAKGQDFVMLRQPVQLESENTVPVLKDTLAYIVDHPGCTKAELLEALTGEGKNTSNDVLVQLAWLVEKGHVIHYYNDVLCGPMEYPHFHLLPGEKASKQQGEHKPEAANSEPPAAEAAAEAKAETPAAEPAAPVQSETPDATAAEAAPVPEPPVEVAPEADAPAATDPQA